MRKTLYIPRETTALAKGADRIAQLAQAEAQQRQVDLKIVRNGSRGLSWLEPLIEVDTESGRIAYGSVTAESVKELFDTDFLSGNAIHETHLGLTEDIPYLKNQQRLTFSRAGIIDPVDIEDYKQHHGFIGLKNSLTQTSQSIIDEVKASGLRGRGGAAFPAAIKWQTVHDCGETTKYIVCNADEGDSGTFADRLVMESDPFMLIEGMIIAGLAVNAEQGYIYLRSEYPVAHQILEEAIKTAYQHNFLGDDIQQSGKRFELEVRIGAGAYICGEETSLLESLEGKRGLVRAKPPLPAIEGLFSKPTLVHNVLSLAAIPYILEHGGQAYADYGQGRSLGTMPFQLAGNIKQGGLIELAFGLTLRDLLEQFSGGTFSGLPMKAIQVGGPLGAYLSEEQWDTPLDYEAFSHIGAVLGHGGIVVFDDTVNMLEQAAFSMEFCAIESCGKCTPCRIGAVRGKEVVLKIQAGVDVEESTLLLEDLCETMTHASLCAMGGMTPFPVQSALKQFAKENQDG
jgi:formate dehydrogenase iron-sulfur subunit